MPPNRAPSNGAQPGWTHPAVQRGCVSVMMPAYRAEAYIGEAIESVLAQTLGNWELWIVLDGASDGAEEAITRFSDPRIHTLRQEHAGEAAARNLALRHLTGEFVAFLDADDLLLPKHLALTVEYLQRHPARGGVYTDGYYIDEYGQRLALLSSRRRGPFQGRIFEQILRASDVFGPPMCTVLRLERILGRGHTFDTRIVIGPDWDFLTRYAESEDFGYLAEPTCLYRLHPSNITRTAEPERRRASLALCREKAIGLPGFLQCSPDVRAHAFYDLLVNLLDGMPERQMEVATWAAFEQLPRASRARLFRLMAGKAVASGGAGESVREWFERAFRLRPWDLKNALLLGLYLLSPSLCRFALRVRAQASVPRGRNAPADAML